jgi:hypothetical protein
MTTADIRQIEAGALAFGQKTYGDDLADAMYLGTFSTIHYFGPVFYDFRISENVESFFITCADGEFRFLPASQFELSSDKDRQDYERRQHIWWDMIGSIQCAYERGKRKIARRMKAGDMGVEQIAKATGLMAEEIDSL